MNYNNIGLTPEEKQRVDQAVEKLKKQNIIPTRLLQIQEVEEFPGEKCKLQFWEQKLDSMKDKCEHYMLQSLKNANLIQNFASVICSGKMVYLGVLKNDNMVRLWHMEYHDEHPLEIQYLYNTGLKLLAQSSRKIKTHLENNFDKKFFSKCVNTHYA